MNEASLQRIALAKSMATVYGSHPGVEAIILGGSTARGVASPNSDIDLGIFWTQLPSQQERRDLRREFGGSLTRFVENHLRFSPDNPRRQGCIEIIELTASAMVHHLKVDVEHETVAGTEQVLIDVLDKHDCALEKQELLSVLQIGIALYGHDLLDRWQEKSSYYPPEVAYKMIDNNFRGISSRLSAQLDWLTRQEWFCLYEGLLDVGRRLLLSLMGLNRVWAFTDNPDFKGLNSFVEGLKLKPPDFVNRLGHSLQTNALNGIEGFIGLSEDVLKLIEAHQPAVATLDETEKLRNVRRRTRGA